jgi:predicted ATPase/class 3 adenylate cyclase
MAACPRCGEENPDRARFCLACGTPLQERWSSGEVRKTVTVLFADVKDSTPLAERLDPEAARGVMNRFFADVRGVIERHGGTVEKFIGDAVMAVFGTPTVHEDDPLRAVRAATEMRTELAELNAELQERWGIHLSIRTGINTGKVVAGDPATGSTFVTGDAVNVGARLETAAGPGEILIGDSTYRLVRDAVLVEPVEPLELKGKAEAMTAWRVLGVVSGAPSVARRLDSPLVGRERELTMLRHAFERAAADQTCQLVTILGPAGAGKSRLAAELLGEIEDEATVLVGRCLPYGEGITFWPVVEIVKRAAGLGPALSAAEGRRRIASIVADDPEAEAIVDRLGGLLGLWSGPSGTDEIFWAVRRLLQALTRTRPVVVLFDDVHWGEQTFLDLVDYIADWARDAPILLVCLARAELLEERPAWAGGKMNATSLLLEPLAGEACGTLIENLLDLAVADEVKEQIFRAAEGNPLFVEELLAMLIDEGAVRREDGRWVASADLSSLAVPPTIQALLDARLDRLVPAERGVIERAAIAGRIFSRSAVRLLSPADEHPSLDERLAGLVRKQLIRPHQAEFGRENTYRFRHSLIRDAAYRQMPKASRAELHERFASWLEGAGEALSAEQEEIIGYHLEQAHRFRDEIGGLDNEAAALGRRGAEHLVSAGRRALSRGDSSSAVALFTRSALLLRDDDEARLSTSLALGAALWWNRQLVRAAAVLDLAREQAAAQGDRGRAAHAIVDRARVAIDAKEEGALDRGAADAETALGVFEEERDDAGLAMTWALLAKIEHQRCRHALAAERLERALVYANKAGEARVTEGLMTHFQYVLVFGPTPVPDAIRRCEEMVAIGQFEPSKRFAAARASMVGYLEAMRGQFEKARVLSETSKSLFLDLGLRRLLAGTCWYSASIELLADNAAGAEREIQAALEHGEVELIHSQFPEESALLAEAVLRQGRTPEALRHSETSERFSSPDDVFTQVAWRRVRARAFALDGRMDEGEALAREAVALAAATDSLDMQGEALLALAEVQRLQGRNGDSERTAANAAARFEQKGNLIALERARMVVGDLARARS